MAGRVAVFCALVAFFLYCNTLSAHFVYDDRRAVLENADVVATNSSTLGQVLRNDFWGTPLKSSQSHGSYRPLTVLTFRWTVEVTGDVCPRPFHIVNVVLHCLMTALVASQGHLVAGLLFAVHPAHCEAVAGVVGRADVLCSLFFLLGVRAHVRRRPSLGLTLFYSTASFLSKEYGLMFLPLCVLYDLCVRCCPVATFVKDKEKFARLACRWLAMTSWASVLLMVRLFLSDMRRPEFSTADNPTARDPSWTARTLTFLYLPVFHFGLLVWPSRLSFDWSMDAIEPLTEWTDGRNIISLAFYSILVATFVKTVGQRQRKRVVLAVLLIVVPFLPATNLFVYVGFVAAERLLYLPSVGFSLLVSHGMDVVRWSTSQRRYRAVALGFSLATIVFGCRTWTRNLDWANEERLYRSAVSINPPKAYGNLGVILQGLGRQAEAEWCYKAALNHRPNMADVHHNLATLYQGQNRSYEALRHYNLAVAYRPWLAESYHQKARLLIAMGRWQEAESALAACVRLSDAEATKDPASLKRAKSMASQLFHNLNVSRLGHFH